MSHEKSVTEPFWGGYANFVGPTVDRIGAQAPGQLLMPLFSFEKPVYPTLSEAEFAAAQRSLSFGKVVDALMQRHREAQRMMGK